MRFKNDLTQMLGVKYPIIQGAFGNAGNSDLAVPVSKAGGLGIITSIYYPTAEDFRDDIRKAKEETDKPFAVNFTLWKGKIDNSYHEKYIPVALDEGIKTIFTSGYDGSYIGKIFKDAGRTWIHKCATIRHAKLIVEKGADAVVIVGREGTGYKSEEQHSTMINMTAARRILKVPIIAAGGIGDARGFIAALAMGASGIYMGTAFMATREYQAPEKFKKKIVNQDITDPKTIKKIYEMKHGVAPSFASGVIESIPPIKEFMETMIKEAGEIIAEFERWGMMERRK
jgi:NAD(P)H-dependent flavin oxidoreductase YrpB (nitropropane dioxygenase family)